MRGVCFTGDRELEIISFPDPTPGFGEVVLEMKASGMCGSDLKQYRRQRGVRQNNGLATPEGPTIAGHEPCGVVAAIGPGVGSGKVMISSSRSPVNTTPRITHPPFGFAAW